LYIIRAVKSFLWVQCTGLTQKVGFLAALMPYVTLINNGIRLQQVVHFILVLSIFKILLNYISRQKMAVLRSVRATWTDILVLSKRLLQQGEQNVFNKIRVWMEAFERGRNFCP
jgi:hypothetical protein